MAKQVIRYEDSEGNLYLSEEEADRRTANKELLDAYTADPILGQDGLPVTPQQVGRWLRRQRKLVTLYLKLRREAG